jgi:hypothetical protein
MKRAITVAGGLEGGTTIVLSRWPRWVNVGVAAAVVAAGVVAPDVPGASGVVNGLAANALAAVVAAAARVPPPARDPFLWIASEVIAIPGTGVGEDTTGIVGELGVVATGGTVIGAVTGGTLGAGVGVAVGVGVEVEAGLGGASPGESVPSCFAWPGGVPP